MKHTSAKVRNDIAKAQEYLDGFQKAIDEAEKAGQSTVTWDGATGSLDSARKAMEEGRALLARVQSSETADV